ncbi:MAG: hypothetical protein QM687_06590 [Ferruginibacter sp.]
MILKIVRTFLVCALLVFPFFAGALISRFSPYIETNSLTGFVTAWLLLSTAIAVLLFAVMHRFRYAIPQPATGGILLFFIGCVIAGIAGLAAPPDLSIAMLKHPEREHCRYILLFAGALLFGAFFLYHFRTTSFTQGRKLMILTFILAFIELIWEFSHHYLYPEALKEWMAQGKKAEDFGKQYDNFTIVSIGAAGRFFQFILIMWLSVQLYRLRKVNLWNPVLTSMFSLLGILSAIVIVATKIHYPKPLEFLFLFFIPGIPFLLLYWQGVALLTKPTTKNPQNN